MLQYSERWRGQLPHGQHADSDVAAVACEPRVALAERGRLGETAGRREAGMENERLLHYAQQSMAGFDRLAVRV